MSYSTPRERRLAIEAFLRLPDTGTRPDSIPSTGRVVRRGAVFRR